MLLAVALLTAVAGVVATELIERPVPVASLLGLVAGLGALVGYRRQDAFVAGPGRRVAPGRALASLLGSLGGLALIGTVLGFVVEPREVLVAGMVLAAGVVPDLRRRVARPTRVLAVAGSFADDSTGDVLTSPALEVLEGMSLDATSPACADWPVERLRDADQVADRAAALGVEAVLVHPAGLDPVQLRELSWRLSRTGTRLVVLGLPWGTASHRVRAARLGDATGLEITDCAPSSACSALKGALDRVGAALLLLVAAPVLAACALAIACESAGSPWFRQVRIGKDGEPFTMVKLRTMFTDAEERLAALRELNQGDGLLFKIKDGDPRITRVGKLLRKSSLDELPQLINVLRGEMSLIGPRPALPREVAEYDRHHHRRLAVRPGMTGLWQVGGRSDLSLEEALRLDLEYVDNWTLLGDASIGARTFGAVMTARGAY